jgi:translation initiation factor eIF-2B subunit gamma
MISYVIGWLEEAGIDEIFVLTSLTAAPKINHYLGKVYESHYTQVRIEIIPLDAVAGGDTAAALRSIRDRISTDFLVVGCDLITNIPLNWMLNSFRLNQPTMMELLVDKMRFEHAPLGQKESESVLFVGLDKQGQRLVYQQTDDDLLDGTIDLPMSMLDRLGECVVKTGMADAHAYLFSRWVVDLVGQRMDLESIREDLIPLLLSCQFSASRMSHEGVDKGNNYLIN